MTNARPWRYVSRPHEYYYYYYYKRKQKQIKFIIYIKFAAFDINKIPMQCTYKGKPPIWRDLFMSTLVSKKVAYRVPIYLASNYKVITSV
jgi:hypothetical protein